MNSLSDPWMFAAQGLVVIVFAYWMIVSLGLLGMAAMYEKPEGWQENIVFVWEELPGAMAFGLFIAVLLPVMKIMAARNDE